LSRGSSSKCQSSDWILEPRPVLSLNEPDEILLEVELNIT